MAAVLKTKIRRSGDSPAPALDEMQKGAAVTRCFKRGTTTGSMEMNGGWGFDARVPSGERRGRGLVLRQGARPTAARPWRGWRRL
jgi:hypothetical protein